MELVFRWADLSDVADIKQFLAESFGPDAIQSSSGRFEALFLEHPLGFHVSLCTVSGSIVGLRCYLPMRAIFSQQELTGAFPVDLMVKPEYRRMGISRQFLDMAQERFPFTVSSGQSKSQAALYEENGAAVVATYYKGYLVRRPTLQGTLKASIRDVLSWLHRGRKRRLKASAKIISEIDSTTLNFLTAHRLLDGEVGNLIAQDTYAWRYSGSYYRDCTAVVVECENRHGILVYRVTSEETQILDIFCGADTLELLISVASSLLPGRKLSARFAGERLKFLFATAGFLIRPMDAKLVVHSRHRQLQERLAQHNWVIFAGDSDTALLEFPQQGMVNEIF